MSHPRLSIIPAGAVTDRSLEPRDLQVLCLLGRHTDKAGWCARSQVKMARELDCSRGSLQNSLQRLVEAGWVEKKRQDVQVEEAGKQPSRSYAYRVLLDRDDFAFESATSEIEEEPAESYAETASEEGGCQPVGTPVPTDQHPGANPCDGTGANTCVGTKNVPLERPLIERERDARARGRKDRFKAAFKAKWPDVATDSQQRIDYALEALSEEDEAEALAGIEPFVAAMNRKGRRSLPAASTYVEEKRWTLLADQPKQATSGYARDSAEARAVLAIHEVAGVAAHVRHTMLRGDVLYYYRAIPPRLLALSAAPPRDQWITLDRQQAGAWEAMIADHVSANRPVGARLREGSQAPWAWPPRKDGSLSTAPPPDQLMTDQDFEDLK